MKEHPILFSTSMVQAILDGRKTMTRRVVKSPKWSEPSRALVDFECPYGWIGDRLWVRETWAKPPMLTNKMLRDGADTWPKCVYLADDVDIGQWKEWGWKVKPSIFMPRWASRITLEITNIRVERLQDITSADSIKEGMYSYANSQTIDCETRDPRDDFKILWDSINGKKHPWSSNPWVWVISFRRSHER